MVEDQHFMYHFHGVSVMTLLGMFYFSKVDKSSSSHTDNRNF